MIYYIQHDIRSGCISSVSKTEIDKLLSKSKKVRDGIHLLASLSVCVKSLMRKQIKASNVCERIIMKIVFIDLLAVIEYLSSRLCQIGRVFI